MIRTVVLDGDDKDATVLLCPLISIFIEKSYTKLTPSVRERTN